MASDQNSNVHFDGSLVGGQKHCSKAQKKGGGRKAHNDMLKSAKPSALQPSSSAEQEVLEKASEKKKRLRAIDDMFREDEFSKHHARCFKNGHRCSSDVYFSSDEGEMEEIPKPVFEMEKQPELSEKQPTDQNDGSFEYKLVMKLAALDREPIPYDEESSDEETSDEET